MTIEEAIEVFVRGFCFTRSFTFPYVPERIEERVWVVRDAHRPRGDYRTEEYVGYGADPVELDTIARRHTRGRYRICAIRAAGKNDAPIRAGFKSLGYRLMTTESFMLHRLTRIDRVQEPLPVVRITTPGAAESLAKAARSRQILPAHLEIEPPPMRQYAAMDGDTPVGWVGSVAAAGCAWCTSMFVQPAYRRRGIARTLMTRMLLDDRESGMRANVLLASHTGSKLYPTVGYEQIGELLAFAPRPQR